jgi:hypothetical protein
MSGAVQAWAEKRITPVLQIRGAACGVAKATLTYPEA